MTTLISPCVQANLDAISTQFPDALQLTVEETAKVLRTSPNNIAQRLKRGYFAFPISKVGKRVFFPTYYIAALLCGECEESGYGVVIETQNTPRAKPKSLKEQSFKERMMALKIDLASKTKELVKTMDSTHFNNALNQHAEAITLLFEEIERQNAEAEKLALTAKFGGATTPPKIL